MGWSKRDVSGLLSFNYGHELKGCLWKNLEVIELRPYQKTIIDIGSQTLLSRGFVYLAMEVRTGKTLTSLGIADKVKAVNVLFVTKKKAISSIEDDYQLLNPSFNLISYSASAALNSSFSFSLAAIYSINNRELLDGGLHAF